MVKKVLEKNNIKLIPIPEKVARNVGLHSGSHVEVIDDGYRIIITPTNNIEEDDFTEEELDKIVKLKNEKGGKTFKTGKAFLKYLEKLSKK